MKTLDRYESSCSQKESVQEKWTSTPEGSIQREFDVKRKVPESTLTSDNRNQGDIGVKKLGKMSLVASDLLDALPEAINNVRGLIII